MLLADIGLNIKENEENLKSFESKNLVDSQSREEIVRRKIEKFYEKAKETVEIREKQIQGKKLSKEEFEGILNKSSKKIEGILEALKNKNSSFEEAKLMLQELNSYEKEITDLSSAVSGININREIKHKIDDMFKIMESALDIVLSADYDKVSTLKLSKSASTYSFVKEKNYIKK